MKILINQIIKSCLRLTKVIITIILVVFIMANTTEAREYTNLSSHKKKALKYYHRAEDYYKSGNTKDALIYLNKALNKDNRFIEAWLLKGDVLSELKNNKDAISAYENALKIDSTFFPPVYFLLGKLYYHEGLYHNSSNAYKYFLKLNNLSDNQKKIALTGLILSNEAAKLKSNPVNTEIIKLDSTVNKPTDEYVNFIASDNKTIIFTRKEPVSHSERAGALYLEKFYYTQKPDSIWSSAKPWPIPWDKELNVGGMSLSIDGLTMYFTGCGWPKSAGGCDLYRSEYIYNNWQKPVNLGHSVNTSGWESQPYVSSDNKLLLFASTRPGGYGGSDIWMSVKLKNGQWSKPVNMGDSINTPRNEMAPFLYADNNTLLFSSDGWPGLGKQDIFISRKNEAGVWSKAENIGYPVNSKDAEINMIYSLNGKQAYLSSNRTGENFNIYEVPVYNNIAPQKILFFKGFVLDKISKTPVEATVTLTETITGLNLSTKRSRQKDGSFLMVLKPKKNYAFNIIAPGYLIYSENISIDDSDSIDNNIKKYFLLSPVVKGESVVLKNLYFETDSSSLQPASYPELNKLFSFLKMNPDVYIEITGHTDSSGDADYNMNLSELRAKSVYNYLIKKGIHRERLSFKGYGNTKPVANNLTEEGKAQNRRVVVTIK